VEVTYLYDEAGSELYERITELPEYYPFRTEKELLSQHARDICTYIPAGSIVVELGCGSAQKTGILLNALAARDGAAAVRFAGVDCSGAALAWAKGALLDSCPGLPEGNIELVCAEYTDGIAECRRRFPGHRLTVLWLGSSVGNLAPQDAVHFFRTMAAGAGSDLQVLLCADLWKDKAVLHAAYCDSQGVTEAFIKNGVAHAFGSLGPSAAAAADPTSWDYEVDVNAEHTQVEMWLRARLDLGHVAPGVAIEAGERVLVEVSRKFTAPKLAGLAYQSGLYIQAHWRTPLYSMQLLVSPVEALRRCWADMDALFGRLPDWSAHPIDVRHPFCFYYGHLASFDKLKMLPNVPPSALDVTFSRGIDPDVEDPSKCHDHPAVPPTWPSKQQLLAYVADVRQQVLESGVLERCGSERAAMRSCVLSIEHQRMHLETLAYMLAQKTKADFLAGPQRPATPCGSPTASIPLPPPMPQGIKPPPATTVAVAEGAVDLGVPTDGSAGFVWDNEGPESPSATEVAPFRVATSPVTIGEYHVFAMAARGYERADLWAPADFAQFHGKGQVLPATWSADSSGRVFVHWPNGSSCSWRDVEDEPVLCSLAEASAYCAWAGDGARIMSEPEYVRLLQPDVAYGVEKLRGSGWEWTSTVFAPLPGFSPMPDYPEYSTDFFDDKHFVLRGASDVTHQAVARDSFRNFYQRAYPYVFAKFRLTFDTT